MRFRVDLAWLTLMVGLLVSVTVLVAQRRANQKLVAAELKVHVAHSTDAIEASLRNSFAAIDALRAFIQVAEPDPEAFTAFVIPVMNKRPEILALSQNALVRDADRAEYEAQRSVRRPGFQITERVDGVLVPAAKRPMYVVVDHIYPLEQNARALGYDINSDPVRAEAVTTARRTGELAVTAPVQLVQDDSRGQGILAVVAADGAAFAVGAIIVEDVLLTAFSSPDDVPVDVWVSDVTDAEPVGLGRWSDQAKALLPWTPPPNDTYVSVLSVGSRAWRVDATKPRAAVPMLLAELTPPVLIAVLSALLFVVLRAREREKALLTDSARRLESALGAVSSSFWDWRYSTGIILLSPSWLEALGLAEEAGSHTIDFWMSTLHPEDRDAWEADLARHTAGESAVFVTRARRRTASGWRWFEDRGRVIQWGAGGEPIRIVGTGTDVHLEEEREQQQRLEEEASRRARRMESLGVLAGGVAHDFNNLLTPILANIHDVAEALDPDSEAREAVEEIRVAALHASSLTRQMLDYVGRSSVQLESIHPAAAVQEMSSLLRASIPRRIALQFEIEDTLPGVSADLSQLKQALLNLVINAGDAQPDGGSVTIRVFADEPQLEAVVGKLPRPRGVCLEVLDRGPGLAGPVDSLFDPFYTTREQGRGLGLAVVQGVALSHGGAVAVSSSPQGTSFQLWLPIAEWTAAPPAPPELEPAPQRPCRVLIVDDDLLVRRTLNRALRNAGHETAEARDGVEAIEVVERDGGFDTVILDLEMPRMGGVAALPRVLEQLPRAHVIICSGYSKQRVDANLMEDPRVTFVSKPFEVATLLSLVVPISETVAPDRSP